MKGKEEPLKVSCAKCGVHLEVSELEPFSEAECPLCGTVFIVPMRFDRYILQRVCGDGSCTTIYRAYDPRLSRHVAVKILNEVVEEARVEFSQNFLSEAKLVSSLNHPGILPIYDCGISGGRQFLVSRYMAGGDLGRALQKKNLPKMPTLLRMFATVAAALDYSFRHARVVHHDVKPANMLIDGTEVRLGDFDLADNREEGDVITPCAGWGTPAYVSPERLFSGGEDHRGDIFSLGASLYELIAGRAPFGIEGEVEELYERRRSMAFPALCSVRPEISKQLSDLVTGMLEFMIGNRPGYAEIIRVLKSVAR